MKQEIVLAKKITVGLITVLILGAMLCFGIFPKKTFSDNENRTLAEIPEFQWASLKDGSYMKALSTYASDHFPFRDAFMTLKSETEKLSGCGEINGVYLSEDGFLIERFPEPLHSDKVITQFNKLSDKVTTKARFYTMLVPTAVTAYNDKLPAGAPDRGDFRQLAVKKHIETSLSGKIQIVDCWPALKAEAGRQEKNGVTKEREPSRLSQRIMADPSQAPLYYRTDHHWTTHGAYTAYPELAKAMGFTPLPEKDFRHTVVSEDFHGTIYSKLNDTMVPGDPITIYEDPEAKLTVRYMDTKESSSSLYERSYLKKKDKYSMFLNNLHPLIEIDNAAAGTDRELVLIKDSYANSMVPFLVRHFKRIYVFDTRYYKFGPGSFINEHPEVSDVLLLYNMNTIDTDLGIGGIY